MQEKTETRKIQKTGIATFTLSLPKSWVISRGLAAGDSLSIIEEKDQSLRITTDSSRQEEKEAIIKIQDYTNEHEIIRKFTGLYLDCFSKITLVSDTPMTSAFLRKLVLNVKKYIGLEIVEEFPTKLVVQDFFTSDSLSIKKAIKRQYSISKMLIEEAMKILNKEELSMENIVLWEDEVDKLYLLVRRQINFAIHNSSLLRQLDITLKECQDYILLTDSIEKITDAFFGIGENAMKMEKLSTGTYDHLNPIIGKLLDSYDMAFNSIFKKDFAMSNAALEKNKRILTYSIVISNEKLSDASKKNFYLILASLHTSTTFIQEIAEIGLGVC